MADISFIKDVKSLKINGEPSHEYELGNDLMRVGGVRQTPRPNNVPVFRDNGYQLDFTVATGGNINFNGIDYPQSTLITSFEAEGKTWLLNEFSGNTIKSETGETATLSVNEGDEFLDSDVWQKKSFALELDNSNNEYSFIDSTNYNMDVPSTGDFEFGGTFTMPTSNPSSVYGIIGKNTKGTSVPSRYGIFVVNDHLRVIGTIVLITVPNFISTYGGLTIDLCVRYRDSGGNSIVELCVDGVVIGSTTSTSSLRPISGTSDFLIGAYSETNGNITPSRYFNGKVHSFYFGTKKFYLREGLGNEVIGSDGTVSTIETSHVDGMRRINYGMHLKGNDVDGWVSYD